MHRRSGCLAVLIILQAVIVFCTGCSEPNANAPFTSTVHPPSWNNTRFLQSWEFHGFMVVNEGTASCLLCHGSDLQGSGDIPGCFTCHFDASGSRVPPGSGWVHGLDNHSDQEDYQSVCNECHGVGRTFDTGPDECHDCHGNGVNHVLGQPWLDSQNSQYHGNVPQDDCSDCHDLNQKCYECHFGPTGSKAPPGTGWNHGNNEAHQNHTDFVGTCNQCHGLTRSFDNRPAECHDCHAQGADHVLGQPWLDKKSQLFHGDEPVDGCSDCHDLSQKCFECHFGATGSKAPPGTGWNHGNNEAHRRYSAYQITCNQCHRLNRSYGNGPASCHDCHEDDD